MALSRTCVFLLLYITYVSPDCIPCNCYGEIMECNNIDMSSFSTFCDDLDYSERAEIIEVYVQNSVLETANDLLTCLPSVQMLDLSGSRCKIATTITSIQIIGTCQVCINYIYICSVIFNITLCKN